MVTFAQTFGDKLRAKKASGKKLSLAERRALRVIESGRQNAIDRMESHVKLHLGKDAPKAGDWSDFDWDKFFTTVMKFLEMLLPFILKLI